MRLRTFGAFSAAALACAAAPARGWAQDTTVVAGPEYRSSAFKRFANGNEYRAEWTTPVRVPVLDPDRFAGGLRVLQAGGGFATESLRMLGRDGRQYVFRSVDKTAERGLPEDLQDSFVEWIVQDLTSAKHPGGAHVVAPLLDAVGVLHATPALYVMPDHPFLGEHRAEFAGRLGQVEERPEDDGDEEDGITRVFAGAKRIVGTDRLFERLEEDPDERVASREFLAARLVDLVVGDWDRHMDQWRWAGFEQGDRWTWRPIPRDRDNAFSDYEGLFPATARAFAPNLTRYGPRWRDLQGYFHLPTPLDRRLLTDVDRPAWDSVTVRVQAALTDDVIARAVRQMPAEWQPLGADELAAALRWRRDHLREASAALYERLVSDVDVRGTDEDDRADVLRNPDGTVDVALSRATGGAPYFRRRFSPVETREIRVYLHGGDDRAVIRGQAARSIQVRLIGGGGDDVLSDSSVGGRAGMSVLHDDRGENRLIPGREGRVDTRAWEPDSVRGLFGNQPPAQDWGADFAPVQPWGAWVSNVGPVIGAGPVWTRYGFRRQPYARQVGVRALYAPLEDGIGVEGYADFVRTGRPSGLRLSAGARTFEVVRFHGFGNDSPGETSEEYEVTSNEVRAEATWYGRMGQRGAYRIGPMARWMDPREPAFATIPDPRGADGFTQYGLRGDVRFDGRDTLAITRGGWWLGAGAEGFGVDDGAFGSVRGEGRTYLSLGAGPILALRAGGELVRGDFPFAEAAFLGGGGSLRGYPFQRFAGDAAAFGSVELRQPLGQLRLLVRGRLGVFALADAGRVWMDGDSPGDWHTNYGGGLWFETVGIPVTLTYARGDVSRYYLGLGMPF
ncbi:BamA/TamA family outer membrane protein [Longimicrobium sp.]|uniref:BamA/TamA family outer membrane protein n=1 Tax=Longimicrobium sp. TaxID=2029185 RepID=UPI002E324C28|nr:BamA/TamA family outer membrane protein [Longimicrobium sp.]HEX6038197.1 BamA/TamA family outer membrane protein [Longimicrobium sp.]